LGKNLKGCIQKYYYTDYTNGAGPISVSVVLLCNNLVCMSGSAQQHAGAGGCGADVERLKPTTLQFDAAAATAADSGQATGKVTAGDSGVVSGASTAVRHNEASAKMSAKQIKREFAANFEASAARLCSSFVGNTGASAHEARAALARAGWCLRTAVNRYADERDLPGGTGVVPRPTGRALAPRPERAPPRPPSYPPPGFVPEFAALLGRPSSRPLAAGSAVAPGDEVMYAPACCIFPVFIYKKNTGVRKNDFNAGG
jgi:hypothetical protein